MQNLLMMKF